MSVRKVLKVQLKTTNTAVDMEGLKENILEKVIISECEANLHHYNNKCYIYFCYFYLFLLHFCQYLQLWLTKVRCLCFTVQSEIK